MATTLARQGDRVLLLGRDVMQLTELDASLCQPELQRYGSTTVTPGLSETTALMTQLIEWQQQEQLAPDSIVFAVRVADPVAQIDELLRALVPDGGVAGCGEQPVPRVIVVMISANEAGLTSVPAEQLNVWLRELPRWTHWLRARGVRLNAIVVHHLLTAARTLEAEALGQASGLTAQQVLAGWATAVPLGALPTPASASALAAQLLNACAADLTGAVLTLGA